MEINSEEIERSGEAETEIQLFEAVASDDRQSLDGLLFVHAPHAFRVIN